MSWIILTILGVIMASISRVLQKVLLSKEKSDPYAFGFVFQLSVSLFCLVFVVVTKTWELPNLSAFMLNLVIMCIFYALANIFMFKAFKGAPASDVSVILISSTMWSVISAIVVLGERLSIKNGVGITLIIIGVLVVQNVNLRSFKINKYHLYALVSAVLYGMAFINDIFIVKQYKSVASYMVIAFALPAFTILILQPTAIPKIKYFAKKSLLPKLFICTFFYALSAIFIYSAYKAGGQASIISSVQQSNVIFIIVLAYLFLNEREKMNYKIVGGILTLCGVLLLV